MATKHGRSPAASLRIRARWLWRKIERGLPAWLNQSLPWGTSLLAHAIALFFMAVVIRFVNEGDTKKPPRFDPVIGQLQEDVTSAYDADQAGDSFTTIAADEPPSMPKDLTQIDESVTAVAEMPDGVQLGPELNLNPTVEPGELQGSLPDTGGTLATAAGTARGGGLTMTAPMLGRSGAERAKLVRREGGSVESERAVERGLDFIARHQREDGGWSLDTTSACTTPPGCPKRPAMSSDVAATGLALLPLLGAGNSHTQKGRYQITVRRGLAWLLENQQPDGLLFTGGDGNAMMYSHCIGTIALCESYALTRDKSLRLPAEMAVGFILRAQHAGGGWRYRPMEEGDTCVFGWAIFALRSANIAGIAIPRSALKGANRYLDAAAVANAVPPKSQYGYQPGTGTTLTMTAEALVCRQLLGWDREFEPLVQGVDFVFKNLESDQNRNIYYWYYATQLLHNMKDKSWPAWNAKMRDSLISLQVKGNGCDRGSWDPEAPTKDQWGGQAGRLFTTSLSLLTLEVYYRYLPLYKDQGGAIDEKGEKLKEKKEDETKEMKKDAED